MLVQIHELATGVFPSANDWFWSEDDETHWWGQSLGAELLTCVRSPVVVADHNDELGRPGSIHILMVNSKTPSSQKNIPFSVECIVFNNEFLSRLLHLMAYFWFLVSSKLKKGKSEKTAKGTLHWR